MILIRAEPRAYASPILARPDIPSSTAIATNQPAVTAPQEWLSPCRSTGVEYEAQISQHLNLLG